MTAIKEIIRFFELFAPAHLAESWDNVGLQLGDAAKKVERILVCLTITDAIIAEALAQKIDLIISHHPLIFHAQKNILETDPVGRKIAALIRGNMSVFSAHTNLDQSPQGVSYHLALFFGLTHLKVLRETYCHELYKIVIYIPDNHLEAFRSRLFESGAGQMGHYSQCSFSSQGQGTFIPNKDAKPFIGKHETFERVSETRLEVMVEKTCLPEVLNAIHQYHPYEEPAFDVIALHNKGTKFGYGFSGKLPETTLDAFIAQCPGVLKGKLPILGETRQIKHVAVCGGHGGSLIRNAAHAGVDVFVTGDIDYHEALLAEDLNLLIFDVGHERSESVILLALAQQISTAFPDCTVSVSS